MPPRWEGQPAVRFLPDGRLVELASDLAFVDSAWLRWEVPAGAKVDGASIPQLFWSLIGGPFEGKYRDASIVHDWYCDRRTRTWQATHKVFLEAMLASGVEPLMAKTMYFAVRWGGPRWEEKTVANNNLRITDYFNYYLPNRSLVENNAFEMGARKVIVPLPSPRERMGHRGQLDVLAAIRTRLAAGDPGLDAIDQLADSLADGGR